MAKKPGVQSLKDILPGVIDSISCRNIQDQTSLENLWKDLAGGEADRAIMVGFKEGCVFINVDTAACLFKMRMRRQTMLTRIRKERSDVQNIVFKIGKVK